jgi:phosphatidylglycerophosphatase A
MPLAGQLLLATAVTALGVLAAGRAGRYWGVTDASPIVIDEVAGYLVTMLAVPFTPGSALLGFLLFRLYDVTKPWPASRFDRMKSAAGVMLDDLAAGAYAWVTLRLLGAILLRGVGCQDGAWYCGM